MIDEGKTETADDVVELSSEFGRTASLERMREIAVALAKPGATNKAGETTDFRQGLDRLGGIARHGDGEDRLLALAILGRIRSQPSNAIRRQIRSMLQDPAPAIFASPTSLRNPQDREYLARSLRLARFDDKGAYLAGFAAGEGPSVTKARNHAMAGLLASEQNVKQALELLAEALRGTSISTQDVGTSRARRLVRVLESFEGALIGSDAAVSVDVGPALTRLLEAALRGGRTVEREAAVELTNAMLSLLSAIVRPNFSCAKDPVVFDVISSLRKLFMPTRWPDETFPGRKALASVVREVIALLAPAGITDNRLRSTLLLLLDESTAAAWLNSMAHTIPGLSKEVRHWLARGRALKSFSAGEAAGETILEGIEKDLADACREARQLQRVWSGLRDDVADAASGISSPLERGVTATSERIDRVARRLSALERRRGFEFEYEIGDAVEYVPAEHETSRPIEGVKMVRVVAPKVVKRTRNGLPQLVLKAKVEPV